MEFLTQFVAPGVVATTDWELFVSPSFLLLAGRPIPFLWAALALAICVSAVAGVLMRRLRPKTAIQKPDGKAPVGELAMLQAVIANLPDPIYVKNADGHFLLANHAAANNMGAASGSDLLGKTDFDFFPEKLAAGFFEDEQNVILSGRPQVSKEEVIEEPNGQTRVMLSTKVPLIDDAGKTVGIIGVGRDITGLKLVEAELRRVQEELRFKAAHDSLTALLNRGAILEMLERECARSVRENSRTLVLLGDLDHFKIINDTHGHPIGDEILREVACRLLVAVRPYDLVGRFGGEEFLVVLPIFTSGNPLVRADQLRKAIAASPISTAHGPISITISLGVLVVQEWGFTKSGPIMREVDRALYAAKAGGRDRCVLATPPQSIHGPDGH